MYFIKVVLISLVLVINKNSCAQPEDHTTDQNEVEKCSSDKKVCGTDGKTYNNICLLQKETGVKLAHEGDCKSEKNGKKKTAYRPDLILKSKIVNSTEENLQKKLVKHFNPTTGKWEYVIDILPTIVITPRFQHLQMVNDIQIPSSNNITNIKTSAAQQTVGAVNAPDDVNNLPFLAKTSGRMFPERKIIIHNSQDPFTRNNSVITEIVENVANNFPTSQIENKVFVPLKNETNPSFQKPSPGNRIEKLNHVDMLPTVRPLSSNEIKPPIKNVLLKNDSISNHINKVQSTENRTLPEKPITEWNKSLNLLKLKYGSLDVPNNGMTRTLHGNAAKPAGNISPKKLIYRGDGRRNPINKNLQEKAKKPHKKHQISIKTNSNLRAPYVLKPHALRHYKPYLPVPKVVIHLDNKRKNTDHEINNVFKPPHKNVSSSYPTTIDNTTHNALNISQPIMNNLTHKISPKISEDHQQPVANVTELSGKETVPLISPVPDPTGTKPFSVKDKYNSKMNDSRPIKKEPLSGNLPSEKLNITRPPKKPEEIPKIMPNNGPNIHRIQPGFHPGHSKLLHSAVSVSKSHGFNSPKNTVHKNAHSKSKSNTKWGTYYIKLPGNVSDYIDLELNWNIIELTTNQPTLTINVSEVIGSKNYTWPKDSKYATDTSTYHKLRSGGLKPINEKIQQTVKKDVWHNTNSRHPQFITKTSKTDDVPINVMKTAEIKTYQLEDELTLKEHLKSGSPRHLKEKKLDVYRFVKPSLQFVSKKFGHSLEKHGSYSLDLPSNVSGSFKLIFSWTLKNKLPKSIRTPIDVTEKQVKYDYKWKLGGDNKGGKPTGNEKFQPIKSVNETAHKAATTIKHSFGERKLTGRKDPGRRLHDVAHSLENVHLDIPKITTKPQLNTTSAASVKTEQIRPAIKLYPGWYYMEMLFNVPGGNQSNQNNDTRKSQNDPTDLLTFDRNIRSLLPIDHPSFLNKYAIEHAKAHQGKCNCDKDKTK